MRIRKISNGRVLLDTVAKPPLILDKYADDADPVEGLLTLADVAAMLKVSIPTVRRLQQQRKIPFVKVGGSIRFEREDVASYVSKRRVRAIGE